MIRYEYMKSLIEYELFKNNIITVLVILLASVTFGTIFGIKFEKILKNEYDYSVVKEVCGPEKAQELPKATKFKKWSLGMLNFSLTILNFTGYLSLFLFRGTA